jgi:hypothetical protein
MLPVLFFRIKISGITAAAVATRSNTPKTAKVEPSSVKPLVEVQHYSEVHPFFFFSNTFVESRKASSFSVRTININ